MLLPVAKRALSFLQAIADTEGEITKGRVQITAAGKQAEKLSKDCIKTQKELDKANADLEGKQQEQQVCTDRQQGLQKKDYSRLQVSCYAFCKTLSACSGCTLTTHFKCEQWLSTSLWQHICSWVLKLKADQRAPCSTALQVDSALSWVL